MPVVHREDRARSSVNWYRLRCPAKCTLPTVAGVPEAARLVDQHLAVCPDRGPAVQPIPGGPAIYRRVYADRISR